MAHPIILASRSPRRRDLLERIGIELEVIPGSVEEEHFDGINSPRDYVISLSVAKALEVSRVHASRWVIAADTVVCVDGRLLGKPRDGKEAFEMLERLSGKQHLVITAFAIALTEKDILFSDVVETTVKVKKLTSDEIKWYINTGEPFDKAGAYAIQGIGSFMIESINGSYTNVVGLPLCEVIEALLRLGAIIFSESGFRIAE